MDSGSDLSSRAVSSQVLSALKGLTSVFGMGTGGTPSSLPPEIVNFLNGLEDVSGSFTPLRPFLLRFFLSASALLPRPFRLALPCRSSRPVLRFPFGFPFRFSPPLLLSLLRVFSASVLSFVPLSSAAVVCLHALALLFPVSAVQDSLTLRFSALSPSFPFRLVLAASASVLFPAPFCFSSPLSAFASFGSFLLPVGFLFPVRFPSDFPFGSSSSQLPLFPVRFAPSLCPLAVSSGSRSFLRFRFHLSASASLWRFVLRFLSSPSASAFAFLLFASLYPDNCTSNDSLTDLSIDLFSWILRSN